MLRQRPAAASCIKPFASCIKPFVANEKRRYVMTPSLRQYITGSYCRIYGVIQPDVALHLQVHLSLAQLVGKLNTVKHLYMAGFVNGSDRFCFVFI